MTLMPPSAPGSLMATIASTSQVNLTWSAASGADHYVIERSQSISGPYTQLSSPSTTSFPDASVSGNTTYLYRVRAVDNVGSSSSYSNVAIATTVPFSEDPLVGFSESASNATPIRGGHIIELRRAINALRAAAGLSSFVWTNGSQLDGSLTGLSIYALDIEQLRTNLDAALVALGAPTQAYPEASLAGLFVKKSHVQELRLRVRSASTTSAAGGTNTGGSLQAALVDPMNRTGSGGEDPLSRNFNWSVPLLNLSGRAGLDLGLALSYNSLVWTRVGSSIIYNADQGTPAPGFRLGFPVIGGGYFNAEAGTNAYLVTMPSGAHVELRQVGSSNTYEAADSSYLQFDASSLQLRTTDGTQLQYAAIGGSYECTEIKDRNGNYITVGYNLSGSISTITDTLARVINFNYDAGGSLLQSITQAWTVNGQAVTHTWATFSYDWRAIQTNFVDGSTALSVNGPANGSSVMALTKVNLDDGSAYQFDYNTYGQVRRIARQTPDSNTGVLTERSVTSYNLPLDSSVAQSDCPRFTERHDTAQDWTGQNGVPAEVVTSYTVPAAATWDVEGTSHSGKVCQVTAPNGTMIKDYYDIGGWQRGLESRTEFFSSDQLSSPKKWTTITWTQDNTTLGYPLNPKIAETNVRDSDQNRRRSTISYTSYGLPQDTVEYDANGTTPLRSTHTTYNLDTVYLNWRIIGLPSEQTMSGRDPLDGTTKLYSKVGYVYDEVGEFMTSVSPVQHDNTNYSSSFIAGRGNMTSVRRYDATTNSYVESKMGYDAAGNVRFTRRPGDDATHQTTIDYTDSFADVVNHNTYAYPTKVTDPDGYQSTVKYRYDIGGVTFTHDPKGAEATIDYDTVGRKQKVSSTSGAQTRVEYPASLMLVNTFTLIDTGVENYSAQILDGAGRVRATGGDYVSHDAASTAVYHAQVVRYDVMGRVFAQSNPTEIDAAWQPAGNDAAGWLWSQQSYDWKGRPLISTNTDGTTKVASYGGCGCAGGEVTTIMDEVGRKQKSYADALGRVVKAQVLNLDGSVYRTTTNTYNARDQVMQVIEAAGESTTGQTTTIAYDGHGRVASKQSPIETASNTYSYNPDDTAQTATDARGVVATFSYNHRRLVTGITYAVPANANPAIAVTDPVAFDYDAAGNRLWMTDGSGRVDYTFDTWSRLRSETRQFTGVAVSFALSYDYNLAGQLKSITDPFNATANYGYDNAGQVTGITGSGTAVTAQYASNMQYRAWGGVKHMSYGNGLLLDAGYNTRLQLTSFAVTGRNPAYGAATVMSAQYQYDADGRIRYAGDAVNNTFDRAYTYDHAGRLKEAYTGTQARDYNNGTSSGVADGPYRQSYQHDVWDNLVNRTTRFWSTSDVFTATYVNDRNPQWQYDGGGNLVQDTSRRITMDAAGRPTLSADLTSPAKLEQSFDGEGQSVKHVETRPNRTFPDRVGQVITLYNVRSSVLGGAVVTELNASGQKLRGYVYRGGEVIATEQGNLIRWVAQNPVTGSRLEMDTNGATTSATELDPMGVDVGVSDPNLGSGGGTGRDNLPPKEVHFYSDGYSGGCYVDGVVADCASVSNLVASGAAVLAPAETIRSVYDSNGRGHLEIFHAYADGYSGFIPVGGHYIGDGMVNPGNGFDGFPENYFDLHSTPDIGFFDVQGLHFLQSPKPPPNPNCIMNAVVDRNGRPASRGLARTYGDVLPNGTINHPGVHALAPLGQQAIVKTLAPLTGIVSDKIHIGGEGGGDGTRIVDVLLDNGNIAIYADLVTVNVRPGQRVNVGTIIGTVGGTSNPKNYSGLHFGLLKGNGNPKAADKAYRNRTASGLLSPERNFINPLGANSPVNCPGIIADPAGVPPVP